MRISDWSSDVCSSDLSVALSFTGMRGLCSATGTVGTTPVIAEPLFALRDGNSAISGADRVTSVGGGFGPLRPRQPASGRASPTEIRAGDSISVIAGLITRKCRAGAKHSDRVAID